MALPSFTENMKKSLSFVASKLFTQSLMRKTTIRSASELVLDARREIENLLPEKAYEELISGETTLIDVRESEEWAHEKIAGAINAPRGMLEFYADPSAPYYKPVFTWGTRLVLYCASGGRSALAVQTLKRMGYQNVAHIDGGIKAWKAADLPVFSAIQPTHVDNLEINK
jgi:rhodanese-related sulfurtransferase